LRAKPGETVATSFEAKLAKTVAIGFEAKPVKTVRVVLRPNHSQTVDLGFEAQPRNSRDEGIPTSLPSSVDDIAGRVDIQHKPDDLRTGPITRARAMLLEQHVNSLLTEYNYLQMRILYCLNLCMFV
jgi:hypothetical protein